MAQHLPITVEGHWLEVRVGKSMGWIAGGVVIALGAIGLAIVREGVAGLVEASREMAMPVGVFVLSGLAFALGLRRAERMHRLLQAAAGGTVAIALVASVWWGVGPILAITAFGLLAWLLLATTPRARTGAGGLGLVGGLADGGGAVCAEAESERARAA